MLVSDVTLTKRQPRLQTQLNLRHCLGLSVSLFPHSALCVPHTPLPRLQDFIFTAQGATASDFGVVPDKQANGCCASDHKPIVATVSF